LNFLVSSFESLDLLEKGLELTLALLRSNGSFEEVEVELVNSQAKPTFGELDVQITSRKVAVHQEFGTVERCGP
jgi:hypothetical protein